MISEAPNYSRTKLACYLSYFTMASVFCVPPLLFITLREMYGISYTLLGTLVLTNFCTQLAVDFVFTFSAKRFNLRRLAIAMPLMTTVGIIIYALIPTFFPEHAYAGLLTGTIVFSIAAGLSEVLLSPTIAAIPSDNPQSDMSILHSLYAFGIFFMVTISTLFLKFFGNENWMFLMLFFSLLPIIAAVLFMSSPMPDMKTHKVSAKKEKDRSKNIGIILCVGCIFFGASAEYAMINWISSYMENALHIDKAIGDIFGLASFGVLLGTARIIYARYGKNICKVLLCCMLGATACYLVAGLSSHVVFAFLACTFTGLFTSMLWPGTLIMMEEKIPGVGVAAYALMAAGGDLGAAVSPQFVGIVIDKVSASNFASNLSIALNLSVEQIGLKSGMLISTIFPILGTIVVLLAIKHFNSLGKTVN